MSTDKNNLPSLLVIFTLVLMTGYLIVNVFKSTMTTQIAAAPVGVNLNKPLNWYEGGGNADGTMGPANSSGNYSYNLPEPVKGSLALYITDPVNPPSVTVSQVPIRNTGETLSSLIININKIEVHLTGQTQAPGSYQPLRLTPAVKNTWETLDTGSDPIPVDLIALSISKSNYLLNTTDLASGHYDQIRLYVDSATAVLSDGSKVDLNFLGRDNIVRVGSQFDLNPGQTLNMTLDFNAGRSIIRNGDKYYLRPVVDRLILQ